MEEFKPVFTTKLNLKEYTMTYSAEVSDQHESDAAKKDCCCKQIQRDTCKIFERNLEQRNQACRNREKELIESRYCSKSKEILGIFRPP